MENRGRKGGRLEASQPRCEPAVRAVALTVAVSQGRRAPPHRCDVRCPAVARAGPIICCTTALHGPAVRRAPRFRSRYAYGGTHHLSYRGGGGRGSIGARVGARSAARLPPPARIKKRQFDRKGPRARARPRRRTNARRGHRVASEAQLHAPWHCAGPAFVHSEVGCPSIGAPSSATQRLVVVDRGRRAPWDTTRRAGARSGSARAPRAPVLPF